MKIHPTFTNYIITKDGNVINKKTNRTLKPYTNKDGYVIVCLMKDKKQHTKLINRLVLETYNPIENQHLYHAHHENRIRNDNNLNNLKWEFIPDHVREHHKGKVFSEEHRRKLSEAKKGKVFSEEHRKNLSEAGKGRVLSEETRRKLSEAKMGRLLSEETRRRMSEANKGKVLSEETRKRMSETKKIAGTKPPGTKGMNWWNDGVRSVLRKECPGEGWVTGRCRPRP